eukprot:6198238-Pleurochrysis_carterae.AAC.5
MPKCEGARQQALRCILRSHVYEFKDGDQTESRHTPAEQKEAKHADATTAAADSCSARSSDCT